jgi:hypothetical protein
MRDALGAMRRDLAPLTKAGVLVIPMDGFAGAVLRSILVGLSFVARPSYPNHVVNSAHDAFRWLAQHIAPAGAHPITANHLATAFESISAPRDRDVLTGV